MEQGPAALGRGLRSSCGRRKRRPPAREANPAAAPFVPPRTETGKQREGGCRRGRATAGPGEQRPVTCYESPGRLGVPFSSLKKESPCLPRASTGVGCWLQGADPSARSTAKASWPTIHSPRAGPLGGLPGDTYLPPPSLAESRQCAVSAEAAEFHTAALQG